MSVDRPSLHDVRIGARLRLLRCARGLSQDALGRRIGVSFQQIQKYEQGRTRIPAARLAGLADALDTGLDAFFEDGTAMTPPTSGPRRAASADD